MDVASFSSADGATMEGEDLKLSVLVDNNTLIDQYYTAEPAVCYHIEDGRTQILFDTGYSNLFLKNAQKRGIDLNKVSQVVLSHGHDDHTGGLPSLLNAYDGAGLTVLAHPLAFDPKEENGQMIGCPLTKKQIRRRCRLELSAAPKRLTERLIYLGEIPQFFTFESRTPIGKRKQGDEWVDDLVPDDTALVYQTEQGLYIITGCSHSGICNIMEYAKSVCKDSRICGVIGGFHLFEDDVRLAQTIAYLRRNHVRELYPCHCVSFLAKAKMHSVIPVKEVGVGMQLCW